MSNIESKENMLCAACYDDNYEAAKKILDENPGMNLNYDGSGSSGKRGFGSPLILTGCKKIGELLVENGADVNFRSQWNDGITALDSAEKTRNYTTGYRKGEDKYNQISEFINWLKGIGAKSCKYLNP